MTLLSIIKQPKSRVFRRAYIKRRLSSTGLFESSWFEITEDIKKWGTITTQIDSAKPGRFRFPSMRLTMDNSNGFFNPETDDSSYWRGYASQQRTLIKIEAGFLDQTKTSSGIWTTTEYPIYSGASLWDQNLWGTASSETLFWDAPLINQQIVYTGLIYGEILVSSRNEVNLEIKPLIEVFRDFPARNISGYDTSMTASKFVTLLRDQTDGSGSYVFRPFFGETTSNWVIESTTSIYINLNTSTAEDVRDSNCWDIVTRLAEAENFIPFVTRNGVFKFQSRDVTSTVSYHFYGQGYHNSEYGHTIKNIDWYGFKLNNYYSRVEIKWKSEDTITSYTVREATLTVSGLNTPWNLGHRTFSFENVWIQTSTVADTLAQNIFDEYSSLKNEIHFKTSFVPHIDITDRVKISYDSKGIANPESVWGSAFWASAPSNELVWDARTGDAIVLDGQDFRFLQIDINLDSFECTFHAREV